MAEGELRQLLDGGYSEGHINATGVLVEREEGMASRASPRSIFDNTRLGKDRRDSRSKSGQCYHVSRARFSQLGSPSRRRVSGSSRDGASGQEVGGALVPRARCRRPHTPRLSKIAAAFWMGLLKTLGLVRSTGTKSA